MFNSKLIFSILFSFLLSSSFAQSFITTWDTAKPGTSNATSITIPTIGAGYSYDVDWDNDGVFDQFGILGDVTHDFGVVGVYTIRIQGNFPRIYFNNGGDRRKIISIDQWGSINWSSFNSAFYGCESLVCVAVDSPDNSNVQDMSSMFRASGITGDFSAWDVSSITDMSFMFSFANQFNSNIDAWSVAGVTNMRGLFWGATNYNQPLNSWKVSKVKDMAFMFFMASKFNQPLDTWDVSEVTIMPSMFSSAIAFNGSLSTWDVGKVIDMSFMFFSANAFDQNLGGWDISEVTDLTDMLSNTALSIDNYDNTLIGWENQAVQLNVSFGANGLEYCGGETARNSLTGISGWNIAGDSQYCPYFITTWQTNNPGTSNMTSITIPTTGSGYDYDVDWDNDGIFDELGITGDVTHDYGIAGVYTIQIRGDFPRIYFDNSGDKEKIVGISRWGEIEWQNMAAAFYGCSNLGYSATDAPDLSNVSSMGSMFQGASNFNGNIGNWDVSNVTNMAFTFHSATSFNQNLNAWNVSNVTDMSRLFYFASNFNSDLHSWDVSSVVSMFAMFQSAIDFNKSIATWNVSNVANMSYMFRQATSFNQPINSWNTSNVTNMADLFSSANAFNQKLDGWDISGVTDMDDMLSNSGLSSINYDATLIGWASQTVQNTVALGANNLTYCEGAAARAHLINTYSWTITGDNESCPFVTTWKTDNSGVSPDDAITIPTLGIGYDYDIDWNNDGVYDQLGVNGSVSHIFPNPGTYTIRIRGDFPRIYFNNTDDREKLININQWGDIEWSSMSHAFHGCHYLEATATDAPDLSGVEDLSYMFASAFLFNGDLSNWDLSNVTNIQSIFFNAKLFNGDVSNWEVSNVTNMRSVFDAAFDFNGDVSNWDVSNVTDMYRMFYAAYDFNGDISSWEVSNVTTMQWMFGGAISFTSDISNWDVSNVTSMAWMFHNTDLFNGDLSNWDVSNVTKMQVMFGGTDSFNGDISNWEVSNVENMGLMFYGATLFNSDLSNWNVSNVTDMSHMFKSTEAFNSDISGWEVSSVVEMEAMFENAIAFNQDLGGWDITAVTTMEDMLSGSALSSENYDNTLIGWANQNTLDDVELGANGLTYCAGTAARNFLINTKNWNIIGDTRECVPFITTWKTNNPGVSPNNAITIPTLGGGYNYDVDWDNDGVYDQFGIFGSVSHIFPAPGTYTIRIRGDFPRIYFNDDGDKDKLINIDQWGHIKWASMSHAFYGCTNLNSTAVDAPDLSNATDLSYMFFNAEMFNGSINHWDVSNVEDMSYLFKRADIFNQNLNQWDVSNVTNMRSMFSDATAFNGDISTWDVSNVESMFLMFSEASNFNSDISNWNISNVTSASWMFFEASAFNSDISNWDISNLTSTVRMFQFASSFNRDLSNWDMSNVEYMGFMFSGATSFNQDLGAWDITSVVSMISSLSSAGLSEENYDNTLIGWAGQNTQLDIVLGSNNLTYCAGKAARDFLINTKNWSIIGDTKNCPAFITTWKTDNPGASPNKAITIPTFGGGYNYDVDWNNDGIFDQLGVVAGTSHIFPAPGTYTIRIRGDFPRIYFNDDGDKDKIVNIEQWGDIEWSSMSHAFYGCSNLNATATDTPDLSNVTDLSYMFRGADDFNGDVSNWDVSNVTNMEGMFASADDFNGDVSNWDVSNVTNMEILFFLAESFNSDVSNWNVSNVVNMRSTFNNAASFNGDLSNWEVSNVQNMILMFRDTDVFNSDIGNWDISNVTEMAGMFKGALIFNRDISNWDVSNVTDFGNVFGFTQQFNQDISSWDLSNATEIDFMFFNAQQFNQDISGWDVSNVEDMSGVFKYAAAFNQDLSNWNVSNVTQMLQMFWHATAFNQDLGGWDIAAVTTMEDMLSECALSTENYDNTLIGWASQNVQANVVLGADDLNYCLGEAAREALINLDNWNIIGDNFDCLSLPVELSYFKALVNENNQVDLFWSTESESNNDYFTIERSKDGINFESVAVVMGAGNSQSPLDYSSVDPSPYIGKSYYRLKQTDFDGTLSYSDIRSVHLKLDNRFTVYPNPLQEVLHVVGDGSVKGKMIFEIFDVLGNLKYHQRLEAAEAFHAIDIPEVANFKAGTYFLVIRTAEEQLNFELVKLRE